jgi:hypothetical protein
VKAVTFLFTAGIMLCGARMVTLSDDGFPESGIIENPNLAEAAPRSSNLLTIVTYSSGNEGHLITFPYSGTTMSIDCASGDITTLSHGDSDHCPGNQKWNRNNVHAGQVLYSDNNHSVKATVVAANGNVIGGASPGCGDENSCSMALWVRYGGFDYLTAGDMYGSVEIPLGEALAEMGINIDVLKASHHGTCTHQTSSLDFLLDISAEHATICGTATSPCGASSCGGTTIPNLVNAGAEMIYCAPSYNLSCVNSQYYSHVRNGIGNITISTDGSTYSVSGSGFTDGPFETDDDTPCKPAPPHLLITEVALSPHLLPENHDWVELYLPLDATPVNLNALYWTDLDEVQRVATGTVTLARGDVVILHDTPGISESDATGKKGNGLWDIYVENPLSGTWNTYDDQFVICSQNSAAPSPDTIIDAVAWSNYDGEMRSGQVDDGNYLIQGCQWGNPEAGNGFFSVTGEWAAAGNIRNGYLQRITTTDNNSKGDWRISQTHSQGVPPPTPTPLPTQPPTIQVILNSTNPAAGSNFSVNLIVQPLPERLFDGYVVITGKAGIFSIQRGNRLRAGIAPCVTNIPALPMGFSGALLNITIPRRVSGNYKVHAGLVDAGTKVKGPSSTFEHGVAALTVE